MKDLRKILLVSIVIILISIFAIVATRDARKIKAPSETKQPSPAVTSEKTDYSEWKLFRNGYALPLPPDWKNTSDTGGTAVLEPGQKIGDITWIGITRLSDAKAPQGQRFTTQAEFDQWFAVSGKVQGTIQKPRNITIDGENAVILFDTTKGETNWITIVWTRKEAINFYITFKGSDSYSFQDAEAIDYITSHFLFVAPASTDKEK